MIKIFAVTVVVCIISVLLKKYSEEFVLPFRLFFACVLIIFILKEGSDYINSFKSMIEGFYNEVQIVSGIVKASFIAVITKLTCDVCKETGNALIQDIVEIGGRIMIFVITLPYISDILNVVLSFAD